MPNMIPQNSKYNPMVRATEVVSNLASKLGFGEKCYTGYDKKRDAGLNLGDTITITVPSPITIISTNMAASGMNDITPSTRTITLSSYVNATFQLSSKEVANAGSLNTYLSDTLLEAANSLAAQIDSSIVDNLLWKIPTRFLASADPTNDLINIFTSMTNAGVPTREEMYYGVDPVMQASLLRSTAYSGTGINNEKAYRNGVMETRYNVTPFATAKAAITRTCGTIATQATAVAGTLTNASSANTNSIVITGLTAALTIKKGDSFSIAGSTQKYVVTADAVAAASTTVSIYPNLIMNYPAGAAVVFDKSPTGAATYKAYAAFNEKAFALVSVPLPSFDDFAGGSTGVYTAPPEAGGYSLRVQFSKLTTGIGGIQCTIDGLFGFECIDPMRAVLVVSNP